MTKIWLAAIIACSPAAVPESVSVEPLPPSPSSSAPAAPPPSRIVTLASGLEFEDLRPGPGPEATAGTHVTVHYVGTLQDGTEFDSSRSRGTPFVFELGRGHVIKGWEEGVTGMREGQIRRLIIPPELAYGARGAPPKIPPNATLVFEVELLEVR